MGVIPLMCFFKTECLYDLVSGLFLHRDECRRPLYHGLNTCATPSSDDKELTVGDTSKRGLYGSELGANMARTAMAEAVGTFMLVFAGTAVATAAALALSIAGAPYNSLAVALAFGLILTAGSVPNLLKLLSEFASFTPPEIML
jgi:hypothetical protein